MDQGRETEIEYGPYIRGWHQSALNGSKREALQSCGIDVTWTYHESVSQGRQREKQSGKVS